MYFHWRFKEGRKEVIIIPFLINYLPYTFRSHATVHAQTRIELYYIHVHVHAML